MLQHSDNHNPNTAVQALRQILERRETAQQVSSTDIDDIMWATRTLNLRNKQLREELKQDEDEDCEYNDKNSECSVHGDGRQQQRPLPKELNNEDQRVLEESVEAIKKLYEWVATSRVGSLADLQQQQRHEVETLEVISDRTDVPLADLRLHNPHLSRYRATDELPMGMRLKIPTKKSKESKQKLGTNKGNISVGGSGRHGEETFSVSNSRQPQQQRLHHQEVEQPTRTPKERVDVKDGATAPVTLLELAETHHITIDDILDDNPHLEQYGDNEPIPTSELILIAGVDVQRQRGKTDAAAQGTTTPLPAGTQQTKKADEEAFKRPRFVVSRGESLVDIARLHRISVQVLVAMNHAIVNRFGVDDGLPNKTVVLLPNSVTVPAEAETSRRSSSRSTTTTAAAQSSSRADPPHKARHESRNPRAKSPHRSVSHTSASGSEFTDEQERGRERQRQSTRHGQQEGRNKSPGSRRQVVSTTDDFASTSFAAGYYDRERSEESTEYSSYVRDSHVRAPRSPPRRSLRGERTWDREEDRHVHHTERHDTDRRWQGDEQQRRDGSTWSDSTTGRKNSRGAAPEHQHRWDEEYTSYDDEDYDRRRERRGNEFEAASRSNSGQRRSSSNKAPKSSVAKPGDVVRPGRQVGFSLSEIAFGAKVSVSDLRDANPATDQYTSHDRLPENLSLKIPEGEREADSTNDERRTRSSSATRKITKKHVTSSRNDGRSTTDDDMMSSERDHPGNASGLVSTPVRKPPKQVSGHSEWVKISSRGGESVEDIAYHFRVAPSLIMDANWKLLRQQVPSIQERTDIDIGLPAALELHVPTFDDPGRYDSPQRQHQHQPQGGQSGSRKQQYAHSPGSGFRGRGHTRDLDW